MDSNKHSAAGLATRAERVGPNGGLGSVERAAEALVGDKQASRISRGRIADRPSPAPVASNTEVHAKSSHNAGSQHAGSNGGQAKVFIGVSDEQGPRSYMEDRHTIIPDFRPKGNEDAGVPRQFVAVYDGHSSHHGSEHASRRVHQHIAAQPAIQQCTGRECDHAAVEAALKSAFEDVDEEIVDAAVKQGKRYGTTAVTALRIGGTLYVAHAGDSRAVLCRDGRAVTLTRDHKPASVPEERERIEAQGGQIMVEDDRVVSNPEGQRRSRLNMSRALGDPDFKAPRRLVEAEPDVARVELRPGSDTFLLLGSDGLFDVMSGQEAVDAACKALAGGQGLSNKAAEAAADALVQKAIKEGTHDNVTALVMAFDWS